MKKNILLLIILTCFSYITKAQVVKGRVVEEGSEKKSQPVIGANIHWSGTSIGTATDNDGNFELKVVDSVMRIMVVQYVGYSPDTIHAHDPSKFIEVHLRQVKSLKEVNVKGKRETTVVSTIQLRNTELITSGELLKAACCNLSESFETNPSIDVNYTDAVTGAKEIQMLGLSGIYTQLLTENIPTLRGLGSIYGLTYIPGPWMESIQISKGAGSVSNGYEATTGQINIEFKKAEENDEKFFLNLFTDSYGRVEANTINTVRINKKWSYMLMLHGDYAGVKNDRNNDGFLDLPLSKQLNIYNRFRYHSGKKLEGQAGIKAIVEDRIGGQVKFNERNDKGTTNAYGIGVKTRRVEAYTKTGLVYPAKPYKSMGLQLSATYHDQQSYFGLKEYNGTQKSFYANYAYITIIKNTNHKIKSGVDYKLDNYDESYNKFNTNSTEQVPGAYAEYTFDYKEKFGLIAGSRIDYHNKWHWIYTPRLHLKYNFTPDIIVRASGGKGFRTPHVYADNIGVMASSKSLVVLEEIKPEIAWNSGANIAVRYKLFDHEGSWSADYYYTNFENQLIVDQYSNPFVVLYYNLRGTSYANSFQTTLTYELIEGFTIKVAYKLDDVHTNYLVVKSIAKPMLSRNKGLINMTYETPRKKWRMNATAQLEGAKPLPIKSGENADIFVKEFSPSFVMLNAQLTKVFKKWELYGGAENILGYTQKNPIVSAANPFSNDFDATNIWGPITGQKFYVGMRLSIK